MFGVFVIFVAAGFSAVNKTAYLSWYMKNVTFICPLCCSSRTHVVLQLLCVVIQIYVT